ncbi:MAG: penicillin acylase family protein [Candidatus Eremiobacteraeota bacterium]|nr:penicillin acylase family protein [Candidatus Eremiobacteraeota bacterium]
MIVVRRALWGLGMLASVALLAALAFAAYAYAGYRGTAQEQSGTVAGLGVRAPVRIDRDERGIPHIKAQNERDAYFAAGYVQSSDRLFQMDLYRRAMQGRLAEVFGAPLLATDQDARSFDMHSLALRTIATMTKQELEAVDAFAAGVNAAIAQRALPPEFRMLGYKPEPWTSLDSLYAGFATVRLLADDWNDVATRGQVYERLGQAGLDALYPISDPAYDAPTAGSGQAPVAPLPQFPRFSGTRPSKPVAVHEGEEPRLGLGSNDFAVGGNRSTSGRALLANDPHLPLRIPGVWYLEDLQAPGLHVAGATLVGSPVVILGHNERIAWGVTNATIASTLVYKERFESAKSDRYLSGGNWLAAVHRSETFDVHFGASITRDYLETKHGFVFARKGTVGYAARWAALFDPRSPFRAFDGLGRATDAKSALAALQSYPGPTQNFVVADSSGLAAYAMAGDVWLDAGWGTRFKDGTSVSGDDDSFVPYDALPKVAPSRDATVFTANARPYGAGYPLRLSPGFEAPYRAARIAQLLRPAGTHKHGDRLDVASLSAIQADVISLGEGELARAAVAAVERKHLTNDAKIGAAYRDLAAFDGRYVEASRGATIASRLRREACRQIAVTRLGSELAGRYLSTNAAASLMALLRSLRERPRGWVANDDYDAFLAGALADLVAKAGSAGFQPWGDAGARIAKHPLDAFGWQLWNGVRFPGNGDGFTVHAQGFSGTQSFRAVWEVGNWDAGGIALPQGESGNPGSQHYRDQAKAWLEQRLVPLPFGDAAVARARTKSLILVP